MKKFITLSISVILVALLFPSCNQSLTKRHYTKGYYDDSRKSLKTEKTVNKQKIPTEVNNEAKDNDTSNLIAIKNETADSSISSHRYTTETLVKEENVVQVNPQIKKNKLKSNRLSNGLIHASKSNSSYMDVQKDSMSGDDDDDHGHSLFWIVILIILLLWLFGYLFLASVLIHFLLLVALILLILWLLRVL